MLLTWGRANKVNYMLTKGLRVEIIYCKQNSEAGVFPVEAKLLLSPPQGANSQKRKKVENEQKKNAKVGPFLAKIGLRSKKSGHGAKKQAP